MDIVKLYLSKNGQYRIYSIEAIKERNEEEWYGTKVLFFLWKVVG